MSNIYRVIDEEHLIEILENNRFKIVLTIYTSKVNDVNKTLKNFLIDIASSNNDAIFIYIDMDNFQQREMTNNIDDLPTSFVYFNLRPTHKIIGGNVKYIKQCFDEQEREARRVLQNAQMRQTQTSVVRNPVPIHPALFNQIQQPMQPLMPVQQPVNQYYQNPSIQQPNMQVEPHTINHPPMGQQKHIPVQIQTQPKTAKENIENLIGKLENIKKMKQDEEKN